MRGVRPAYDNCLGRGITRGRSGRESGVPFCARRNVGMRALALDHMQISIACRCPTKGRPDMHMYASAKVSALADGFRRIRPGLLAAGGLSIFINLLVFVSPLYTMQIYDRVLTSR